MEPMRRFLVLFVALLPLLAGAQERLTTMPGYAYYQEMLNRRDAAEDAVDAGRLSVRWEPGGMRFSARRAGKIQTYDVAARAWLDAAPPPSRSSMSRGRPGRGRQFDVAYSDDGKWKALYRDANVYLSPVAGGAETPVTTDGSLAKRLKYGTASWVYGEELDQREAMWFSPDGSKLAFYRFDEAQVEDYYVTVNQGTLQDAVDTEAYPLAGAANPHADVCVYDRLTGKTITLDAAFGEPEMGEYVYNVSWSPNGKEILFFRENRLQNRMQFCAADPNTGACRTILEERNPQGWVLYRPGSVWLETGEVPIFVDDHRFIWVSQRTGYSNAYLYDLSGALLSTITHNAFDLQRLEAVDPKGGVLWYSSHDGDLPTKLQLHRVQLNGREDALLTDPHLSHRVKVAPASGYFVDVAETVDVLPSTRLCDPQGAVIATLATADAAAYANSGLGSVERITCKAADNETDIHGWIAKPGNFDPHHKYPLLLEVYAGPEFGTIQEEFQIPSADAQFGFVVGWFDGRGSWGRGRDFCQVGYRRLGTVEIDDQAAAVTSLDQLPYIDAGKVGVFGTSYGGYAAAMELVRHPNLFQAASASSPVTDWRNYDSTYTERYMGLPADNAAGYTEADVSNYVPMMKGSLQLYFGSADNNVHPSNSLQLLKELDQEGKDYELEIGTDEGHSGVEEGRMLLFFITHLRAA